MKCSLLLLVSLLALTGCAERIECTIYSQPGSAVITAPGENFHGGYPVIRRKVTKADRQAGYLVLKGVNARWNSGAYRTVDITIPIKAGERNFNFCMVRPPGGNLKADLQYDAQIVQQNAQKAADEAAARAATARNLALTAGILNSIGAGLQAAQGLQPTTTYTAPVPTTTYTAPPPATSMQRVQCSYCKGKRKNPTDNLSAGVPTFGLDGEPGHCDICNRDTYGPHVHGPCPICHGTGYAR